MWNYVLALRHHHDTRVELRPYVKAPPWTPITRFMKLSPIGKAPLGTPIRKVHGITSNRWGATKSSHYKSHGITPYPHFIRVPPTHQSGSSHNINIMYKQQFIQLMLSNSCPTKQHTISISNSHINHGIIPYPPSKAFKSDKLVTHQWTIQQ